MAKRSRNRQTNRDHFTIANPRLASSVVLTPLKSISDLRTFHPLEEMRPLFSTVRKASRVLPYNVNVGRNRKANVLTFAERFRFADPRKVAVCVRRKQRREVLFALRKTGAGGRKRRNQWSNVKC